MCQMLPPLGPDLGGVFSCPPPCIAVLLYLCTGEVLCNACRPIQGVWGAGDPLLVICQVAGLLALSQDCWMVLFFSTCPFWDMWVFGAAWWLPSWYHGCMLWALWRFGDLGVPLHMFVWGEVFLLPVDCCGIGAACSAFGS